MDSIFRAYFARKFQLIGMIRTHTRSSLNERFDDEGSGFAMVDQNMCGGGP